VRARARWPAADAHFVRQQQEAFSRTESYLIAAFTEGIRYEFVPTQQYSASAFGGPGEITLRGPRHGPAPLHFIGRISKVHLPILARPKSYFDLPLVYGMRYSGCRLGYRLARTSDAKLTVTGLVPRRSSSDWPYEQYPSLLPYVPLKLGRRRRMTYEAFARRYPNMADAQPADLVVVVPPPFGIGVSLWGPIGDAEGVTLVFECDVSRRAITAYNICT
jgi:hypothetical protein